MADLLTPMQRFLFVQLTGFMSIVGSLFLWFGLVMIGRQLKRFQQIFGRPLPWRLLSWAPIGVFIYLFWQSTAALQQRPLAPWEQWLGYSLLTLSAGLCAWGAWRFSALVGTFGQARK